MPSFASTAAISCAVRVRNCSGLSASRSAGKFMRTSLPEPCRRRKRNCLRPAGLRRYGSRRPRRCVATASPAPDRPAVRASRHLGFAAKVRPGELPLVQASRGQPDADPVVNQDLHAVGAPIGEQIGMVWVSGAEHLDHTCQGRIGTGAHVQWIDCQPDLVDTDHRSHSRSQAAHWVASDTGQLTVID